MLGPIPSHTQVEVLNRDRWEAVCIKERKREKERDKKRERAGKKMRESWEDDEIERDRKGRERSRFADIHWGLFL